MATALDYRPSPTGSGYDPRVVELMKQYNIYHPGLNYPRGSKQAAYEAELLTKIMNQVSSGDDLHEKIQSREAISQANREQRSQSHEDTLALTRDSADARNAVAKDRAATARAEQLEFIASNPMEKPDIRAAASAEMVKQLGLNVTPTGATTAGGVKGEYGPDGAPTTTATPTPTSTTTTYTPPTAAFANPNEGTIPVRPTVSNRYFNPSRYPASEGFTPQDRTRIAGNLDRANAEDAAFNELMYKRDIGGENYARVYGTETARPGQPPAADIPSIYGGTPTIPDVSPVGYYDKGGNFLGPLYNEAGGKLPMPKGATGIHGTAAIPGVYIDPETGVSRPTTSTAGAAMAGQFPVMSSRPQGVLGPYGEGNRAPNEAMNAEPVGGGYKQPTTAFAAPVNPAPVESGVNPIPNPTPGGTPAPDFISQIANAPLAPTPTPAGTPPAVVHPQASNDRTDLLNEIEGTFYGGGQAPPQPTPKPTPKPQHLALAHRILSDYYASQPDYQNA